MKRINLLALVIALACVVGIFGMVNGKIQTVIGFADPLNEIVFTVLLFPSHDRGGYYVQNTAGVRRRPYITQYGQL